MLGSEVKRSVEDDAEHGAGAGGGRGRGVVESKSGGKNSRVGITQGNQAGWS